MNSREHLAEDLERIIRRSKYVGYFAWLVALIVMVYGTPIVYNFLVDHDVPAGIAWLLSLAADGALIVGLIATPILAELNLPAGWVGTLRWVAGFITWALQTAGSWTTPGGPDMVGVLSHTAGPVLLFFSVEAASSFQRKVATALIEKARELESAEQRDADRRAHLAETEASLRATCAELAAVSTERDQLAETNTRLSEQVVSVGKRTATETADLRSEITRHETETAVLRDQYETRLRTVSDEHAAEVRELRKELRRARAGIAETGLDGNQKTSLDARAASAASTQKTRSAVVKTTDEDHLQAIRDAHPEWSSKTVTLGQVKAATGITGQATVIRLRDALYPDGRPDQTTVSAPVKTTNPILKTVPFPLPGRDTETVSQAVNGHHQTPTEEN